MSIRKGMMVGKGSGYKNVVGRDPAVHSQSAKGIKQPQAVNIITPKKELKKYEILMLGNDGDSKVVYIKLGSKADFFDVQQQLKREGENGEILNIKELEEEQTTESKKPKVLNLIRVSYGKSNTPAKDREYQIEGEGAVGTLEEYKMRFPFNSLNIKNK